MMQLVEKGFFGLDDSVEKYFPEIRDLQEKPEGNREGACLGSQQNGLRPGRP